MSELQVVMRPIAALIPYVRNARTHSDGQVAQIAASIVEFGWTSPILIDADAGVIAGHGRLLAARQLGLTEVPTISLAHLTPIQRRAYVLADNQLALNAGWDEELLRLELEELQLADFDLDLIGFGDEELAALLVADEDADSAGGNADEDAVPDAPAEPITRPGDLWLLGKHRLLCGDATCANDVGRLLDGAAPKLMVTDPPYGVEYDPNWRNEACVSSTTRTGRVSNDDRADWREAWTLFPGDVAYVWHAGLYAKTVQDSLEASHFNVRSQIVWVKPRLVLSRGHYHWRHEPCWYAVRKGAQGNWQGSRDQTTVWEIGAAKVSEGTLDDAPTAHGTQKPVECMLRPIINNSAPGDAVYEPFAGSGTTVIACEKSGRVCYALELDPVYCDIIVERWQNYTGRRAERVELASRPSSLADLAA
jgi:DNA modification methylase